MFRRNLFFFLLFGAVFVVPWFLTAKMIIAKFVTPELTGRVTRSIQPRANSRLIDGKKVPRTLVCGTILLSERMPANAERPLPYIHSKSALSAGKK
jgi:hypothetical protein